MFITFEGIEGSGKSTQIQKLAEYLRGRGHDVVLTREPGGTEIGNQIRKVLLSSDNSKMVPDCELLLYYAARAQHLDELIRPSLESGKVVLCDRFVDATVAYQGYARGLSDKVLRFLNEMVLKGLKVDLSLLFDLPVEAGLARAKARADQGAEADREDRFERELVSFHEKVRAGYLDLAKKEPKRFEIVDAGLSIEDLFKAVVDTVEKRLEA